MYLAANISNPLVAPWLLVCRGAGGRVAAARVVSPADAAGDQDDGRGSVRRWTSLVGSVFVGGVLASLAAAGTYAAVRELGSRSPFRGARAPRRRSVCRRQHHRLGVRARQAAGRSDLSRHVVRGRAARRAGRSLDVGCGQGLTLALLAEARRAVDAGTWPRRVAAAAAVRTDGRHRDAPRGSRRSRARRSRATPRSSKATPGRCRWNGRARCCCSTSCT